MLEREHLIISIVEPSQVQAHHLCRMLADAGISRTEVHADAAALLARLEGGELPDLVISAMYLPDMTGTELVYRLRETEAWAELPFMLITSESRPHVLDPVRQAGALALLPKPFSPAQLDRALSNALDFLNAEELGDEAGPVDLGELTVLVVDDSTTARQHIRGVLQRLGIERIHLANNGREAVSLLDSVLFDLVFTDYNMPEMDGRELTEYIRTRSMQSSVPVLMISSESDEGRLAAVQQAGVSAVCDKPFDAATIRRLIDSFATETTA